MTVPKSLMLGSAQWGWNVSRTEAFRLLDEWLATGRRDIDCATNYPINRNPADFRAAEKILLEYVRAHGLRDLRITMKIGSLDNMRSPEVNLAPSFVWMMGEEYHRVFGENLYCLMFHWDNREDATEIHGSLEALAGLQRDAGIKPGLSGIKFPEKYAQANEEAGLSFDIQLKHNVLQSDFERYAPFFSTPQPLNPSTNNQITKSPNHQFFAYGINAGGVKLDEHYEPGSVFLARGGQPEKVAAILEKIRALLPVLNTASVRPPVKTMNHVGLIYAGLHPGLSGILLGVSSVSQLKETLDFWRNLETFDYGDAFQALTKIAR
ncbi:MAG TPA: aldo/keto reductase [Saprospiraceae bacterium]|nr:aldo/keto reductase [Saprospiraceae bacterium]